MSNRAWVTLATNDSYSLGALVLAHSLRRVHSIHPAVVLITPSVTDAMRERLHAVFAQVVTVDVLDSRDAAHLSLLQRPELGITFTKIHCWELIQYEKCVFLDADTLVVQNCDELFEREELSAAPDVGWPDCFNSGVFVFKPAQETFYELIKFAEEQGSFDGGDQGLLNAFFSDWARGDINKHLPFLYNVTSAAFYSYLPALKHYGQDLKIIHFIGTSKPWLQKFDWESRSVNAPEYLKEFLQLWWDLFVGQVHSHLNATMVEVQEAPPAIPPHDFSQHYMPVIDPESEFPWHHPDAQLQQDTHRPLEIDMTQFHDPWEMYRGNIPSNKDDLPKRHSLSGRVEDHEEMKKYAWEYQTNQYVPYFQEATTHQQTHNQHHHIDHSHIETQSHHHHTELSLESRSQHSWEAHSQHSWDAHSHQSHGHDSSHNHHQHSQEHWHQGENSSQDHDQLHQHHHHFNYVVQNHNENKKECIVFGHEQYHHDHHNRQAYHVHDHQTHSQTSMQFNQSHNPNPHITEQNVIDNNLVQYEHIDNIPLLTNEVSRLGNINTHESLNHIQHNGDHNENYSSEKRAQMNGDVSDSEYDHDDIIPRHPYDGFYLRHRAVINSHGRKICTHEIPETPMPSPPPEMEEVPIFLHAEELFVANGHSHDEDGQSGVAGNLARVVPGSSGPQREALDELTRRQGWEAGNIDYLGADSFDNIWAKISQTLNQSQSSPPKQLTPPPKEPSPPKESPSVEVAQEAAVVDAPVSEATVVAIPAQAPVMTEAPAAPEPVVAPVVVQAVEAPPAVESPAVAAAPAVVEAPLAVTSVVKAPAAAVPSQTPIEIPATVEAAASTPEEAAAVEVPTQATTEPSEIAATVEASTPGEAPAAVKVASVTSKVKSTEKTEKAVLPTPPASPVSTPLPATESPRVEPVVEVVGSAKKAASVEASPVSVPPISTPEKAQKSPAASTDSPPLAYTPSKDAPPVLPDAKSTEEAAQETRL